MVLALVVNAVVLAAKAVAGVLTGSSVMVSEAAHSVADTLNEGFLLTAPKRSDRAPDDEHPFGYGKERFFWSLIAAVGIFVAGAGFSQFKAWKAFTAAPGSGGGDYLINHLVFGGAAAIESVS